MSCFDRFKDLIVEHLGVDKEEVTPEASLVDDLGADSLDGVELLLAAEEAFAVEITDDEGENLALVKNWVDLIDTKIAARTEPVAL